VAAPRRGSSTFKEITTATAGVATECHPYNVPQRWIARSDLIHTVAL
jgi:hypothetical protein